MIEQEILKASVKEIPKVLSVFLNTFTEIKEEIKFTFGEGIQTYISLKLNSFSNIKTILHRQLPKYFYDIYQTQAVYCNKLRITIDSHKSLEQFGPYITVIGGPGSGKTTLLRHIFMSSISLGEKIPLYLELRRIDFDKLSLNDIINQTVQENFSTESKRIIKKLLELEKFIILLDGFDELTFSMREKFIYSLNNYREKYPNNFFILTSRPSPVAELIPNFTNIKISNFTLDEAISFIEKQDLEEELLTNLKKDIKEKKWNETEKFLSNPLLLSTFILTYKNNSTLPEKNSEFYERVSNALFSEHDSWHKNGYVRKSHSELSIDSVKFLLNEFAFKNTFKLQYSFDSVTINSDFEQFITNQKFNAQVDKLKEDLTVSYGILTEDSGVYQFIHRSLQDYFAAQKVQKINSLHKTIIYDKIYDLTKRTSGYEIGNFIEFISELDDYYYNKLFMLRVLSEFFTRIDEDFFISSIISIFYSSLNFDDSEHQSITIPSHSYRAIFEFSSIERLISKTLFSFKFKNEPDIKSNSKLSKHTPKDRYVYSINKANYEDFENMISKLFPKLKSELESEVQKLSNLRKTIEEYLEKSLEEERRLLENL
ncbi:NACHT domain-containing protein [Leptospira brenneri]|uniref:NACHT domain-containing protein n=1 Tax=Leptospira brenneri TaxID=2023182 RepID=UPI000C2B0533|nr:NACHT domain-containing protein [Leptospira brenneri]PJZ43807.1 hypothetical protein CH361_18820 [Leptospira brenneri]